MKRCSMVFGLIVACVFGVASARAEDDGWVTIPIEPELKAWSLKAPAERSKWTVGTAVVNPDNPRELICEEGGDELVNAGSKGVDIFTKEKFADAIIEVEVLVPRGSNSGIYIMGSYEVQVLDSHGREELGMGDMGAVYSVAVPQVNAAKKPGEWQKYVIEYRAPAFDADGNKTANGRIIKVVLNDTVIHENLKLQNVTGGSLTGKEAPRGPVMFQGDHGPVAYRNLRVKPLD
ncbi:MAG: 3-keto-disaccharide hydrolase [Planctomycetota bacterium]